ncbi:MAG: flagellar basal body L-ring protein FlgH [Spirochaetes bacterium]|nr:flagellar basal body L-ring protein FlgH [Spirochaetota bacterium]
MKKVLFIIMIAAAAVQIYGESLWRDRNVYSSEVLVNGDTVIVAIEDISQLRFSINLESKTNSAISSEPDVNITGFLPKVSASKTFDNKDNLKLDGRTNMRISVATSVTGAAGNGNYNINGYKEYIFNGVLTRFTVTGVINPAMLDGRKIKSENVINFRMDIQSAKSGINLPLQRAALEEGKSADSTLTEEEKQAIILDYLRKMLNELSR